MPEIDIFQKDIELICLIFTKYFCTAIQNLKNLLLYNIICNTLCLDNKGKILPSLRVTCVSKEVLIKNMDAVRNKDSFAYRLWSYSRIYIIHCYKRITIAGGKIGFSSSWYILYNALIGLYPIPRLLRYR